MPPRAVVEFLDRQRTPYEVLSHLRMYTAGTHGEAIRMRYSDFERLVRPSVAPLSRAT